MLSKQTQWLLTESDKRLNAYNRRKTKKNRDALKEIAIRICFELREIEKRQSF